MNKLTTSEWAGYSYASWPGPVNLPLWAYNPPDQHYYSIAKEIGRTQDQVLDFFFQPLVLQRIDENPTLATARTMTIGDLFDWLRQSIYGDLSTNTSSIVRRNLQPDYEQRLIDLAKSPHDSLAAAHLEDLATRSATALKP